MKQTVIEGAFVVLAVILAGLYIVFGALLGSGIDDEVTGGERVAVALWGILAGAVILAGLYVSRRSLWLGFLLLALGTVPLAVVTWWSIVTPVATLLLVVLGVYRVRRLTKGRSTAS